MGKAGQREESVAVPSRRASPTCTDIVSPQIRSRMMAAVGQKDTRTEMAVRRILHALGIRYRIRNRDLPGSPDIANRAGRWAVFVNGCFWHGHKNCRKTKSTSSARVPKTRADFWSEKLVANRARDAKRCRELRRMGYRVMIVWECNLALAEELGLRLRTFCAEREGRQGDR
jgi:DNA mismatch endonuclease, patch repair protein